MHALPSIRLRVHARARVCVCVRARVCVCVSVSVSASASASASVGRDLTRGGEGGGSVDMARMGSVHGVERIPKDQILLTKASRVN